MLRTVPSNQTAARARRRRRVRAIALAKRAGYSGSSK